MFKNISDFFYTILDKLKLNIKDKEQLKYNLKKYNFIVLTKHNKQRKILHQIIKLKVAHNKRTLLQQ